MSLKKQKILKISLTISSKKEILENIQKGLKNMAKNGQKSLYLVTPNPEQVVLAHKNSHFAEFINQADVAIPDGVGLVWAYGFLGLPGPLKRITGVALMEDLMQLAEKERIPVGLIGGRGGVAVAAFECLQQKYPRVIGWAIEPPELEDGAQKEFLESIAQKIKETKTQMVFVGLGAPKQEFFIEKLRTQIPEINKPVLFMSVGGAFDEISGRLPMPPKFIDRYGLKWLWRLILEPWRWKRQLALLEFIGLVLKEKIRLL